MTDDARSTTLLVVHGMNWSHVPSVGAVRQRLRMRDEGRLHVHAAAEMYRRGACDVLLLAGGRTARARFPSEAAAMRELLRTQYPSIPAERLLIEEHSHTTGENVRHILQLLARLAREGTSFDRLVVMKMSYELPRVRRIYRAYGVHVDAFVAAEDVLDAHPSRRLRRASAIHRRSRYARWRVWVERCYRLVLYLDPRGTWSFGRRRP